MRLKRVLVAAAALGIVASPANIAAGHGAGTWYNERWNDRSITYWLSQNVGWTQQQITGFTASDARWSDIANESPDFNFSLGSTSTLKDWTGCGNESDDTSIVERVGSAPWSAATVMCDDGFPDADWDKFWIRYNTCTGAYTDYWGANIPEALGKCGVRGTLTHEFGHAAGFNGHWNTGSDDAGANADPDLCLQAGQGGTGSDWSTMCQGSFSQGGEPRENYQISLRIHDEHTFTSAFP